MLRQQPSEVLAAEPRAERAVAAVVVRDDADARDAVGLFFCFLFAIALMLFALCVVVFYWVCGVCVVFLGL